MRRKRNIKEIYKVKREKGKRETVGEEDRESKIERQKELVRKFVNVNCAYVRVCISMCVCARECMCMCVCECIRMSVHECKCEKD
jgi:hypothetical protein